MASTTEKSAAQLRAQMKRWETALERDRKALKEAEQREADRAQRDAARAAAVERIYAAFGIAEVADDPHEEQRLRALIGRLNGLLPNRHGEGQDQ